MGSNGPETSADAAARGEIAPGVVGAAAGVSAEPGVTGDSRAVLCPFCGGRTASEAEQQCSACGARTDLLSRQATQNEMGPWFVRDETAPFRPGCRLETIERWARTGRIHAGTVMRGPSTHQNWVEARRVPGVSRLFGVCHACGGAVDASEVICGGCGAGLTAERDRQHLGLSPVRPLPGRAPAAVTAGSLIAGGVPAGAAVPRSVQAPAATPEPRPSAGVADSGGVLFKGHLARAKQAAWTATAVAVVAVCALVAVLLGVRFGVIESVRPPSPVAAQSAADGVAPDDPGASAVGAGEPGDGAIP